MGKVAFVFPGQGVQKIGMGKDFYDSFAVSKRVFEEASDAVNIDMQKLCFEENEKLNLTEYTQCALVTVCLSMLAAVNEEGIFSNLSGGLSLGEYCAIYDAGGISLKDAVMITRKRGELMQNAVPAGRGAMAAILGLDGDAVKQVIEDIEGVWIANLNCPGQVVITGEKQAVGKLCEAALVAGAKRTTMLNVSGPFHSPLLKSAGDELFNELSDIDFKELKKPYVTNVTGELVFDVCKTPRILSEQVFSPVLWQDCVLNMIKSGTDTFLEIGPGKTVSGFIRRISKDVNVLSIESIRDLDDVKKALLK